MDLLFRLGIPLFVIHHIMIIKLIFYFKKRSSGIFFGLIGLLTYGLFHETYKEPQGAFLIAMLIATWSAKLWTRRETNWREKA